MPSVHRAVGQVSRHYGNGLATADAPGAIGTTHEPARHNAQALRICAAHGIGAARIAASGKRGFGVTDLVPRGEILSDPARRAQVLPQALLEKIKSKAGVKY